MTVWEQAPEGADAIGTQDKMIAFTKNNHKFYWNSLQSKWLDASLPFNTLMVKPKVDPKWTHTDADGVPCKLLVKEPDATGHVIIEKETRRYASVNPSQLKERQPQISKEGMDAIQGFFTFAMYNNKSLPYSLCEYLEICGAKDSL